MNWTLILFISLVNYYNNNRVEGLQAATKEKPTKDGPTKTIIGFHT